MTHDYTDSRRRWGHDLTYHPSENGLVLSAMGWGRGLVAGDYILLTNKGAPGGSSTTRYQIETVRYNRDPADMWRATLRFAPRIREAR